MQVYPPHDPYVSAEVLERIVLKETAEQFTFQPEWDAGSQAVELTPGKMVTWAQNAPHRIVNGPMLNVSLSIEFMTAAAVMRANLIYANGILRRRAGLEHPRLETGLTPSALAKLALARMVKASGVQKPNPRVLPVSFVLDHRNLGDLLPVAKAA